MYGKYFLSVEAPGDDEEPAAEVEEVKPKNKKKDATSGYEDEDTDFNGMIDDEEPEENDGSNLVVPVTYGGPDRTSSNIKKV